VDRPFAWHLFSSGAKARAMSFSVRIFRVAITGKNYIGCYLRK